MAAQFMARFIQGEKRTRLQALRSVVQCKVSDERRQVSYVKTQH